MGIYHVTAMHAACAKLVAQAASLVGPHNHHEIEELAANLHGLHGLNYKELKKRFRDFAMPADFRHLRLHNLSSGQSFGGRYCTHQSQLTINELLLIIHTAVALHQGTPHSPGIWTETVALPVQDPGVLELGLRFKPE